LKYNLLYIILFDLNTIIQLNDQLSKFDFVFDSYEGLLTITHKSLWMEYQNNSILIRWKNNGEPIETLVYNGKYIAKYKAVESL
jgi:hypothetical protein